jgi:hypothetical protein
MFVLLPLNEHEIINSVDVVELQAVSFETYKYSLLSLPLLHVSSGNG